MAPLPRHVAEDKLKALDAGTEILQKNWALKPLDFDPVATFILGPVKCFVGGFHDQFRFWRIIGRLSNANRHGDADRLSLFCLALWHSFPSGPCLADLRRVAEIPPWQ